MKYFDYAATTPTSKEALDAYVDVSTNVYGNPGSSQDAKKLEQKTREEILKVMGLTETCNLVFTSGGTEANNLAIKGIVKNQIEHGSHFITAKIEHASVYEVFQKLENGNNVSYIGCTKDGYIDTKEFKKSLRPNTKLVSFMQVNNELGTEQPIRELYDITKEYNEDIIFIVDAVQGIGKVEKLNFIPDIFTISSHKIYGPKSVGAVIMKKELSLSKLILGGTKEMGQRAGTQSLPAQVGFAKSVQTIYKNIGDILKQVKELKEYLQKEIQKLDKVYLNAKSDSNVVSIFIDIDKTNKKGIEFFHKNGILLSAKSADSNDLAAKSRTLKAMGLSDYICDRTYRISLSHHKTFEDIDELVKVIRKFVKENESTQLVEIVNNKQLEEHLALRELVFINEQKVDKLLEIDQYDILKKDNIVHYSLLKDSEVVGVLRAIVYEDYVKLGRVAIKKEYRSQGYGQILVQKVMADLDKFNKDYYIEAQVYAEEFYKRLGFKKYGQLFYEANIEHIRMLKPINNFDVDSSIK